MLKRNRQRGFTLIELLIVVAIIGIIAAILIPNLIDALQKAKQKRTVADLRNVGTAVMSWITDNISASAAGGQPYDATGLKTQLKYAEIRDILNPPDNKAFFYMQEVPQFDGWGNEYLWFIGTNLLAPQVYILCSYGRNGTPNGEVCNGDHKAADTGPFIATDYDRDIMFADGYFIKYPGNVKAGGP